MIGHSDDAKMTELLAPLRRLEPVPFAAPARAERRHLRKPVLVAGALLVALALTGVAIADSVGAFNGIGAAQRPQNGSDVLDPRAFEGCTGSNAPYDLSCHLVLRSARLIRTLPSGRKVFVVTDDRGDLCVVVEGQAIATGCGSELDAAQPTTAGAENDTGDYLLAYGVAVDGITAVSFTFGGNDVTVPVEDNVWAFEARSSADDVRCITVHYADGRTFDPFPEAC